MVGTAGDKHNLIAVLKQARANDTANRARPIDHESHTARLAQGSAASRSARLGEAA
jgi:hypothetical protein